MHASRCKPGWGCHGATMVGSRAQPSRLPLIVLSVVCPRGAAYCRRRCTRRRLLGRRWTVANPGCGVAGRRERSAEPAPPARCALLITDAITRAVNRATSITTTATHGGGWSANLNGVPSGASTASSEINPGPVKPTTTAAAATTYGNSPPPAAFQNEPDFACCAYPATSIVPAASAAPAGDPSPSSSSTPATAHSSRP